MQAVLLILLEISFILKDCIMVISFRMGSVSSPHGIAMLHVGIGQHACTGSSHGEIQSTKEVSAAAVRFPKIGALEFKLVSHAWPSFT